MIIFPGHCVKSLIVTQAITKAIEEYQIISGSKPYPVEEAYPETTREIEANTKKKFRRV